ncbi:MAG: hypothetical protein ACM3SM_07620 [Bacteroidota bacterium]
MELMDIIISSLLVFLVFSTILIIISYTTYKIRNRNRVLPAAIDRKPSSYAVMNQSYASQIQSPEVPVHSYHSAQLPIQQSVQTVPLNAARISDTVPQRAERPAVISNAPRPVRNRFETVNPGRIQPVYNRYTVLNEGI